MEVLSSDIDWEDDDCGEMEGNVWSDAAGDGRDTADVGAADAVVDIVDSLPLLQIRDCGGDCCCPDDGVDDVVDGLLHFLLLQHEQSHFRGD